MFLQQLHNEIKEIFDFLWPKENAMPVSVKKQKPIVINIKKKKRSINNPPLPKTNNK